MEKQSTVRESLSDGVAVLKQMGWGWTSRRAWYVLHQRLHPLSRRLPIRTWQQQPLSDLVRRDIPTDPLAYQDWREFHAGKFFFETLPSVELLESVSERTAIPEAEALLLGRWRYFGAIDAAVGFPPDWHRNPFTGEHAPADRHWSKIPDFAFGDIKLIWEASRFSSAYTLARAYALTGSDHFSEAFWKLVEDWASHNPPQLGANWKCGQEAAFRIMAWCFGLYAFANSERSTPERKASLAAMIAAHAYRIEANLNYALVQNNNHGISEAVGLFTVGLLFPEFQRADEWVSRGRELI